MLLYLDTEHLEHTPCDNCEQLSNKIQAGKVIVDKRAVVLFLCPECVMLIAEKTYSH